MVKFRQFIYLSVLLAFTLYADRRRPAVHTDTDSVPQVKSESPHENPNDPKIKIELSRIGNEIISYIKAQNWKNVENRLSQILKIDKNSLEYYYFKGAYLYSIGDYKSATIFLDQAIEKNPDHDPSYYLLGMIQGKHKNWEKAVYYLDIAVSKTYNPFYNHNLAVFYFLQKNYNLSKSSSEKTLELKQNYFESKLLLLKSLVRLNQFQEALILCEKFSNEKVANDEFIEIYAQVLFENKKDFSKIAKILLPLKDLQNESKRILAYSLFKENRFVESSVVYKQIFQSGIDFEKDFLTYLEILMLLEKDAEADLLLKNSVIKPYTEKEKYFQKFNDLKIDRDVLSSIYKPIPWR